MSVELRLAWTEAADRSVPLPAYATEHAAGADIRANMPPDARGAGLVLAPGARRVVPTGLRAEIPPGWEIQVRPRSGLARDHGVTVANAPGTIDADYRGEIGVLLVNLGTIPCTVRHGDRIAQLVVAPVAQARIALVDRLSESARGQGGFGSTGLS